MSLKLSVAPELLGKGEGAPITARVTGRTVGECLEQFAVGEPLLRNIAYDERGSLKPTTRVYLNSIPVFIRPLEMMVKDRDEIDLLLTELEGR